MYIYNTGTETDSVDSEDVDEPWPDYHENIVLTESEITANLPDNENENQNEDENMNETEDVSTTEYSDEDSSGKILEDI